ncbi:MAG: HPr kinase/phosphatase C-terminal domain-containing protein, partial [Marinomonas sp.]
ASQIIQASCVAIDGRAVMIEGEPGSGKSSLALALIDRGARLIGDDGVTLTQSGEQVIAAPPPNIAGKMEIRHVGVTDMPATSAPLALIITLADNAPRLVEPAPKRAVLGMAIPELTLPAHDPQLALRAEYALQMHGLKTA